MSVKLNGKEIKNWTEYIYDKFSDSSLFDIKAESDSSYLVNSKTNKTTIWFSVFTEDALTLHDCQYHNEECKGWSGETTSADIEEYGTFNQENVDALNDILKTPIENGWLSIDYYIGGTFYKSKTYYDKDRTSTPFVYANYGCLTILLFPIFWFIEKLIDNKLIDNGLVGQKREISIEPIKNNAPPCSIKSSAQP